ICSPSPLNGERGEAVRLAFVVRSYTNRRPLGVYYAYMKSKLILLVSAVLLSGTAAFLFGCKRNAKQSRAAQTSLVVTQNGKITLVNTNANLWRASVTYHGPGKSPTNV